MQVRTVMSDKIIKSYLCQGKEVNLVFSQRQNAYIIQIEKKMIKMFPPQTPIKVMEKFAMQELINITDKN